MDEKLAAGEAERARWAAVAAELLGEIHTLENDKGKKDSGRNLVCKGAEELHSLEENDSGNNDSGNKDSGKNLDSKGSEVDVKPSQPIGTKEVTTTRSTSAKKKKRKL